MLKPYRRLKFRIIVFSALCPGNGNHDQNESTCPNQKSPDIDEESFTTKDRNILKFNISALPLTIKRKHGIIYKKIYLQNPISLLQPLLVAFKGAGWCSGESARLQTNQ